MNFTESDVRVMLALPNREKLASAYIRKLSMLRKTVATHRLKELRHLRALKKLAAWRRSNGFDRCDVHDRQWTHSPLPPAPEEITVRMWADVNASRKEISMSEKESLLSTCLDQARECVCVFFVHIPRIHHLPHLLVDHHMPV